MGRHTCGRRDFNLNRILFSALEILGFRGLENCKDLTVSKHTISALYFGRDLIQDATEEMICLSEICLHTVKVQILFLWLKDTITY